MNIFSFLTETEFSTGNHEMNNVISSPNFNVVRVCLPKGLDVAPHTEPNATFFLVIEGSGIFTKGDENVELHKNDSIFIKAGEIRGIKCLENLVLLGVRDPDPKI